MNIAERLITAAKRTPTKNAIIDTRTKQSITFAELDDKIARICQGLLDRGFKPGQRTLLFVKPSLDFHALVFSLFRLGIIPVLIDPGMGRKNLLAAIEHTKPEAMIAESVVHWISYFFKKPFASIKFRLKSSQVKSLLKSEKANKVALIDPQSTAAILFTSGGTGKPKGVVYTQDIFEQQTIRLQKMFELTSGDVDLPGFPLFSLFTLAMGMTTLIPDMDPTKPGQCDPAKLIKNIQDYQATFVAGSPAIWSRVSDYANEHKIQLPSIKQVVMFGAPVKGELHQALLNVIPNGNTFAPYGATEALPLCLLDGKTILQYHHQLTLEGAGTCVGPAIDQVDIAIIKITDEIIETLNPDVLITNNTIGEIIVRGATVTKLYDNMPEATAKAKIADPAGGFWHRMGDLGYLDATGNLWFCGRKAHRVYVDDKLLTPIPIEAIANQHPAIKRSALIGAKNKPPGIVVEIKEGLKRNEELKDEILSFLKKNAKTSDIEQVFFSRRFPVDVRHNIKIDRQKLSRRYL